MKFCIILYLNGANKEVHVLRRRFYGWFVLGGGTKKIEIFGWNSTKNEDGFMNFITWSEQIMRTVLYFLK